MFRNLMLAAVASATLGAAAIGASSQASAHEWGYGGYGRPVPYSAGTVYYARPEPRPWFAPRPYYRPVHYGFGYGYRYNRPWFHRGW